MSSIGFRFRVVRAVCLEPNMEFIWDPLPCHGYVSCAALTGKRQQDALRRGQLLQAQCFQIGC